MCQEDGVRAQNSVSQTATLVYRDTRTLGCYLHNGNVRQIFFPRGALGIKYVLLLKNIT